jgi:tetratricopeptide (TPR) repeat protein
MITILTAMLIALAVPQARSVADEQRANAHYRAGWEAMAREAWDEAAREFQGAIDANPTFKFAYYGLGRAHMGRKQFADAIQAYQRCRDLYVEQASRNLTNKSDADRIMKDDLMTIDATIQRLQTGPQTLQTQTQITQWQAQKQRMESRLRGMDSMSLTSPVPAFVSLALGSAYLRSDRYADAEREYKTALDVDPKSGETYSNLAVVYLLTKRYDEAESAVKAAEKAGFKVNPALKEDIKSKKKAGN